MNLTLSTGRPIVVRDIDWQQHSVMGDTAICKGFGSLVIGGLFLCHDMDDASDSLSLPEVYELQAALDAEATRLCAEERVGLVPHAGFWEKRSDL